MKNTKVLYGVIAALTFALIGSIVINYNQTAKLKNGKEITVKIGKTKITAEDLYSELKEKYSMSILIDKIDHTLFDSKYKTDDKEKKAIDTQVNGIKSNYNNDESMFIQAIQSYYGTSTEEEFRDLLSIEYKRNLAVHDYIEDKVVTEDEIKEYYETKTIGEIKASHILIKSKATDKDSQEEKTKKEEEAKKKAENIIKKLKDGEDFKKLAKKYSDDKGTSDNGGDLGYFNSDDNYEENFVNAAATLEIGKFTEEPIKTEYGYEIILKVAEKDKPKLNKVKNSIKENIANEKLAQDSSLYYNSLVKIREEKVTFKDNVIKRKYQDYIDKILGSFTNNSDQ